jgi:hypothetical protein
MEQGECRDSEAQRAMPPRPGSRRLIYAVSGFDPSRDPGIGRLYPSHGAHYLVFSTLL